MYSRDFMSEKREKMSIFSVVTKISTYGGTLKLWDWNNLNHFLDAKDHVDFDYETQMAKNDDNKGHIVDFLKISRKKSLNFSTKKFIENFPMFFLNSPR